MQVYPEILERGRPVWTLIQNRGREDNQLVCVWNILCWLLPIVAITCKDNGGAIFRILQKHHMLISPTGKAVSSLSITINALNHKCSE